MEEPTLAGSERVHKKHNKFTLGIYFSSNAGYSCRYGPQNNLCLILCYAVAHNPYPVIFDDAPSTSQLSFIGKANYKHYGSHYVPVIPYGDEKSTKDFRPPPIGDIEHFLSLQRFRR